MGTLHSQLPRFEHLSDERVMGFIDRIKKISNVKDVSYKDCLETVKLLATIDDYDTKDEQLDSFGYIFEDFISELDEFNGVHKDRIEALGEIADSIGGVN